MNNSKSNLENDDDLPLYKYKKNSKNKNNKNNNLLHKKIRYEEDMPKIKNKKNIIYDNLFIILLICIALIFIYLYLNKSKEEKNLKDIEIDIAKEKNINFEIKEFIEDDEFERVKKFIDKNINIDKIPYKYFKPVKNPKISIVIPVYNGEPFIETSLLSIQNQNFRDIEIIIVDDYSKDNSVLLIKELMKKDSRIVLYQNKENKGALYSKTYGVLNAKGKYVMILEQGDIYVQNNAFSSLYDEAEKNNLYILGFGSIIGDLNIRNQNLKIIRYIDAPIIFQPYISRRMYVHTSDDRIIRNGDILSNYFFKTSFFIQSIKYIKNIIEKKKMNYHEEFLLFFLLTRNSYNLKQIKRIFHCFLERPIDNNPKIIFHNKEKIRERENIQCMNYLNYAEFLLENTINTISDKKIASFELDNWFLNHKCKENKNPNIKKESKIVLNKFLSNKYIEEEEKNRIKTFLDEMGDKNEI